MAFKRKYKGSVATSATTGEGLDKLADQIRKELNKGIKLVELRFPITDGSINAFIRKNCEVLEEDYTEEESIITTQVDNKLFGELRENSDIQIKELDKSVTTSSLE